MWRQHCLQAQRKRCRTYLVMPNVHHSAAQAAQGIDGAHGLVSAVIARHIEHLRWEWRGSNALCVSPEPTAPQDQPLVGSQTSWRQLAATRLLPQSAAPSRARQRSSPSPPWQGPPQTSAGTGAPAHRGSESWAQPASRRPPCRAATPPARGSRHRLPGVRRAPRAAKGRAWATGCSSHASRGGRRLPRWAGQPVPQGLTSRAAHPVIQHVI